MQRTTSSDADLSHDDLVQVIQSGGNCSRAIPSCEQRQRHEGDRLERSCVRPRTPRRSRLWVLAASDTGKHHAYGTARDEAESDEEDRARDPGPNRRAASQARLRLSGGPERHGAREAQRGCTPRIRAGPGEAFRSRHAGRHQVIRMLSREGCDPRPSPASPVHF
jgi:hypothetical protein